MSKSIAILGRQPALGVAELEKLYGAKSLNLIRPDIVVLDQEPVDVNFDRLGGTVKLCKLLTRLDFTDWGKLTDYLIEHVPKHVCCIGPGKLIFGISTIGFKLSPKQLERTGLSVKRAVKATDRPVRLVPNNNSLELNSAQVLHNKMTASPLGMELVLIRDGKNTILAQTTNIQNIEAYAARDQMRPKRDARVGMLPPKLAQIIINLSSRSGQPDSTQLLDPFCGTGVLLQEAMLMGYSVYGTDLEPRMIQYSQENLEWLSHRYHLTSAPHLEQGNAATHHWQKPVDFVACETYLGQPFAYEPDSRTLQSVINEVDDLHQKFLKNLGRQLSPGTSLCLAVPAWFINGQIKHLRTLDSLEKLGYTRVSFVHSKTTDLIYHREKQIVGRELVVLIRK
jgi:tRNA G10  N-methylase Trm11